MKLAAAIVASIVLAPAAQAAAIRAATFGCSTPADATRLAAFQGKAAQDAAAQPLVATRACLPVAKGIIVDIDETRAPLACIRLTGDLSCYWIAAALVDEHPGEKGGPGRRGGSNRHGH